MPFIECIIRNTRSSAAPVARILLEREQRLPDLGQVLGRLFEEEVPILGEVH